MRTSHFTILCTALLTLGLYGCGGGHGDDDHAGHDHGEHDHSSHPDTGPNGGHLIEVGAHVAHLEVLHDDDAGAITLTVLGPDGVAPFKLSAAPQLKLRTSSGPRVLDLAPTGGGSLPASSFEVTDEALKEEPEGRVSLVIDGKSFNPELEHTH